MFRLIKRAILSLALMGSSTSVKTVLAMAVLGTSVAMAEVRLQGSGATFPNPLYQKWVTEYQSQHPDVKIDYQSIGSGGGIKAITAKTVDFAGSDAPLTKKETEGMGGQAVHIPTTAGGVVLAYNLPGFTGTLNLSGPTIADIYMGKITKWNDPKIAADNAGASLPDQAITAVYRTDGSGTTSVFTNYLATQAPDFKETIGVGKAVNFKGGQGGKGNEGVTAAVKQTPGAVGYVELNYAMANDVKFAAVKNQAGKFVVASTESVSAAGKGALEKMTPGKLQVDIWNQAGDDAYPISSFTYIIVYKDLNNVKSPEAKKALVGFLNWAVTDGQQYAAGLKYAPLADAVREKAKAAINGLAAGM